jgi:predicted DNA-binding transcriptional regulator AlpA
MIPVPTLDELAANPERALDLSPSTAGAMLARLAGIQTVLLARLLAPTEASADPEDRLLDVAEAAEKLHLSQTYLYRNHKRFPFTVRVGNSLRFSSAGIAKWIRTRQGRV